LTLETLRRSTSHQREAVRYSIAPVIRSVVRDLEVSVNGRRAGVLTCGHPSGDDRSTGLRRLLLEQTVGTGRAFLARSATLRESKRTIMCNRCARDGEELRCSYVIGADGANSRVRNYRGDRAQTALRWKATCRVRRLAGHRCDWISGRVPGGYGWVFPKGDHLNVGLVTVSVAE